MLNVKYANFVAMNWLEPHLQKSNIASLAYHFGHKNNVFVMHYETCIILLKFVNKHYWQM
jgi:hypothetical protein